MNKQGSFSLKLKVFFSEIRLIEDSFYHLSIDIATVIQNRDFDTRSKTFSLKTLLYKADKDGYNFPWYIKSCYFDNSKQWIIYTSHEFKATFVGEKCKCGNPDN